MASGSQNMTTYLAKGLEKVLTTNAINTNSLLYINTADTNITADMLGATTSIAFTRMSTTGAYTTGHIVWLNAADIGTPFQLVVHDSSDLYLYKRWKSSGTWTDWTKMKAGTADTWTTARTLTVGGTGKSVDGSADVSWSMNEIMGSSDSSKFYRGDKTWSSKLTGNLQIEKDSDANIDVKCTDTSCSIQLDSFHDGRHGIWSNGYWDGSKFVSGASFLGYRNTSGVNIWNGNANTATKLSNTPNNTTTFLRGDNTWTNTLTGTFYSTGSPGFQNVTAAGTWAYLQLKSGTLGWDIASVSSQNSGALDFRPHKSTNHGIMISQDGGLYFRNPATEGIYYAGTKATYRMIRFIDNTSDTYGNGISIGGGGQTIIGGGESADTAAAQAGTAGAEIMQVCNDGNVEFISNLQNGWDNRKVMTLNTSGYLLLPSYINVPTNNNENPTVSQFIVTNGSDHYYRKASTAHAMTAIRGAASGSWGISITGNATTATALYTGDPSNTSSSGQDARIKDAIKAYFDANKASIPRNKTISLYVSTGNGEQATGYFLNGYDSAPYGGFFVCHYDTPRYVGISNGNYSCYELVRNNSGTYSISIGGNAATATRINGNLAAATSNVDRNIWVSSTASADGIPNYISYFNMNPSTKVFTVPAGTRISPSAGDLYLGNSGNQKWVYIQDMCSQDGQKWKIHQNGNAEFTGTVTATKFSGPLTGNVTGNCSGSSGSCTGNAATASKVGEATSWLYFHNANEVNFGGTSTNTAIYFGYRATDSRGKPTEFIFGSGSGTATVKAAKVYGAVWNDYAEYRIVETIEPGRVVQDMIGGRMILVNERLQPACKVISDTYGFAIGATEQAKTPIAVCGRVLVYPYQAKEKYKIGMAVCSAPNGTVDIMTREEIKEYPDRIIGTVSEIPTYEVWSGGAQNGKDDIQVNGRIWIYVR